MNQPRVPIDQWGKDHWSTLAYIESRCVDHKGVLSNAHLRTNVGRHPLFVARGFGSPGDGSRYPTRYKDGSGALSLIEDHDDWDCLYDMLLTNLITVRPKDKELWDVPVGSRGPIKHRGYLQTKELKVVAKLTHLGNYVAGELREHLAKNYYQEFSPSFAPAVASMHGGRKG